MKEKVSEGDVMVVEGGKGEMCVGVDVVEKELGLLIGVCGVVKDGKEKR
ncbi:hypothetical protein [Paenibacillus xylanexedens]|nr:hypothetical protein [Paenibacillus xylanexedens]